jgi:O-antigen/teichoic acid export membrane protein
MKKDLFITCIIEFINLISGLLVYKFASHLVGEDTFSQYALCRRTVSFILPVFLLGLSVGMPRYIAFASSNDNYQKPDMYFFAGISVLFTCIFFFTGLLNIFKTQFSFLFFGNAKYANLIFPISIMIVGLVFHGSCYAYYRGKILMVRANILQVINIGLIPILVFFINNDIVQILFYTGLFQIIISMIVLLLICKNLKWNNPSSLFTCIRELLTYGAQRVPGDFGMAALLSLPAIITAHIAGIKEAGYVAFGTTILNMTGALFAPFGLVLLPKASQLIARKDMKKLKSYILRLGTLTLFLTLTGLMIFEIFANKIISVYLGETFEELTVIARIIMLACLGYTFYVSMRSILDAYYIKAVNTKNVTIALLSFLAVACFIYVLNSNYIFIVITFMGALYVLGSLTFYDIFKMVRKTQEDF